MGLERQLLILRAAKVYLFLLELLFRIYAERTHWVKDMANWLLDANECFNSGRVGFKQVLTGLGLHRYGFAENGC